MRTGATLIGLLIFLLLLMVSSAYGQLHNNHWYFGNQQALEFSSGTPRVLNDSKMLSIEANSTYSDPNTGELLLYANGETIWNRKHGPMSNGTGLWGHQSATQGTIICPKPGSANLIYVFHIDRNGFAKNYNGALNYSLVDMKLDDGLGGVVADKKNISLMTESTEKLSIIPHQNGCGLWVIAHKRNSNSFHSFLLTDLGIDDAIISNVGQGHTADTSAASIGQMAVSSDGSKIAVLVHQQEIIELFRFDRETGKVHSPLSLQGEYHDYGIAFSPSAKLLYVSNFAAESHLRQYQISDWNELQADTSMIVLDRSRKNDLKFGGLQLGPDGILYLKLSTAEDFPDSLGAILYPDIAGKDCRFKKNYLHLPLNHGAHAYGPELNFSNLMHSKALPFGSECFSTQGAIKEDEKIEFTNRPKKNELE